MTRAEPKVDPFGMEGEATTEEGDFAGVFALRLGLGVPALGLALGGVVVKLVESGAGAAMTDCSRSISGSRKSDCVATTWRNPMLVL